MSLSVHDETVKSDNLLIAVTRAGRVCDHLVSNIEN